MESVTVNFNLVWKQYEKELTAFVKQRLFDKSLASDIMQEVAIKIFKKQNQLAVIDNVRAWVYRVTRNTLIDFYKQNGKSISDDLYTLEFMISYENQIEDDLGSCIQDISKSLKQTDEEILNLSIIEEYTIKEISLKLNLSINGTKSKLKRAKKKLANNFFSCCNLEKDTQDKIINFKSINAKKCSC